ncbi:MAG: DciA family protein [Rivularia sp. ALOHA_DT_140]|nr:DciA family protein [Rivularia sp. ALOHA_DT_140]
MSFESIPEILEQLQIETLYQQQPLHCLLDCWQEVVGKVIATHTQPISIERDVLWVATSGAAWAQNLTFERRALLKKLNHKLNQILPSPLVDIRFYTARWQRTTKKYSRKPNISSSDHPSYLVNDFNPNLNLGNQPLNPQTAFANWAQSIKMQNSNLPLCPNCQSPTPQGELERWGVCSICAARSF